MSVVATTTPQWLAGVAIGLAMLVFHRPIASAFASWTSLAVSHNRRLRRFIELYWRVMWLVAAVLTVGYCSWHLILDVA